MKINLHISACILFCISLIVNKQVTAQDTNNEFQSRSEFQLSYKPIKKIKISITPELRFNEAFAIDEFLAETKLDYKLFKHLSLDASYRIIGNVRETKSTEYLGRYAFSITGDKKFKRFTTEARLRYTNYADDEEQNKKFLRTKVAIEYDIKDCKITPNIAIEAFRQLDDKEWYKMRYTAGFDYKLFKKNKIGLNYKLDYYLQKLKNRHIISLCYKLSL